MSTRSLPHPGSIFQAVRNFKDNEFGGYGEALNFLTFRFMNMPVNKCGK